MLFVARTWPLASQILSEVLAFATANNLMVLTEDTDFGELPVRQRLPTAGVVLLRLSGMDRTAQPDYGWLRFLAPRRRPFLVTSP